MSNSDDPDRNMRTKLARLVDTYWWTFLSFLSGLGLGFLALTEFRSGPIIAGLAGLGVYFLVSFALPKWLKQGIGVTTVHPSKPTSELNAMAPSDDPRVDLLVEAHQHNATLAAAISQLPLDVGAKVDALRTHALAIIEGVSAEPTKLTPVLRFFTYYLPSTADLVMDRIKLASHAGSARLGEIDLTLGRLIEAFAGFEAAVLAPDLQSVDLDVELLEQALNADLRELKQ